MSKLKKGVLSGQVDTWLICCKHDGIKVYGNCKKCPCEEICKQAEQQIKKMIQKSEVTEEWIEEKAKEMIEIISNYCFSVGELGNARPDAMRFIRSLVEETK